MVAESFAPGASVSEVAQRYGVNANLLFTWRRQNARSAARGGAEPFELLPVESLGRKGARRSGRGVGAGACRPHGDCAGRRRTNPCRGGRRHGAAGARGQGVVAAMIPIPAAVRVWLATGRHDMRKGFDGLALIVQETLKRDPHSGRVLFFAVAAAISSSACGTMGRVCVCSRNGWSEGGFCGRRQPTGPVNTLASEQGIPPPKAA